MTCDSGSFIGLSCLIPGTCPDFSACTLLADAVQILGDQGLRVGYSNNANPSQVIAGDSTALNYYMNLFRVYAQDVVIEGNAQFGGQTVLRAVNGGTVTLEALGVGATANILSTGSILMASSTGSISLLSSIGTLSITNNDATSAIQVTSQGPVNVLTTPATPILLQSDLITLSKAVTVVNNSLWLSTGPDSYSYVTVAPQLGTPSIFISENVVIGTNKVIVALGGTIQMGPNLDIGNGRITSLNTDGLKLGVGTFLGDDISMEAPIDNRAAFPLITNASVPGGGLTDGYVYFNDTNGYRFATGPVLIESDLTVGGRFSLASTGVPTFTAGAGACTTPTITVVAGSIDCKMQISVVTGTGCVTGIIATITYSAPFTTTVPGVVFSPANANAAALTATTSPYVTTETAASFVFSSGSAALTATTTYLWNFQACA